MKLKRMLAMMLSVLMLGTLLPIHALAVLKTPNVQQIQKEFTAAGAVVELKTVPKAKDSSFTPKLLWMNDKNEVMLAVELSEKAETVPDYTIRAESSTKNGNAGTLIAQSSSSTLQVNQQSPVGSKTCKENWAVLNFGNIDLEHKFNVSATVNGMTQTVTSFAGENGDKEPLWIFAAQGKTRTLQSISWVDDDEVTLSVPKGKDFYTLFGYKDDDGKQAISKRKGPEVVSKVQVDVEKLVFDFDEIYDKLDAVDDRDDIYYLIFGESCFTQTVLAYFYLLKPGESRPTDAENDASWSGKYICLHEGQITGVNSAKQTYYTGDLSKYLVDTPEEYKDYELQWYRIIWSNGANCNENQEVHVASASAENCWHVDGMAKAKPESEEYTVNYWLYVAGQYELQTQRFRSAGDPIGDEYYAPTAPAGKRFDGWYTDVERQTSITESDICAKTGAAGEVINFYGAFTEDTQYTVRYDANGGTGTMASAITTGQVTIAQNSFTPPHTDDQFAGWNTASDGSGTAYTAGQSVTLTQNTTLYAQWNRLARFYILNPALGTPAASVSTKELDYYPNSGSNGGEQGVTKESGYKTGYLTQKAWSALQQRTLFDPQSGFGKDYLALDSLTLGMFESRKTAVRWYSIKMVGGAIHVDGYLTTEPISITYHENMPGSDKTVVQPNLLPNEDVSIKDYGECNLPQHTPQFVFDGWNTASDGSGTAYTAGQSVTLTQNTALYAKWKPAQFIVTFRKAEHTDMTTDVIREPVKWGTPLETLLPEIRADDGYTLGDWKPNNQEHLSEGKVIGDLVLATEPTQTLYHVSYMADATPDSQQVADTRTFTKDTSVTPMKCPFTPPAHKHFGGWTGKAQFAEDGTFLMPARDVYLIAKWEDDLYTVTFKDYDGKVLSQKADYKYGDTLVLPATPSRADDATYAYTFREWSPAIQSTISQDAVYTAQYTSERINVDDDDDDDDHDRHHGRDDDDRVELDTENHFQYLNGYEDGTIRPTASITREEATTIFYRLLTDASREKAFTTRQDFNDVIRARWSNKAIATMNHAEIVTGYPEGDFRPNQPITRGEFAAIITRFDELSYHGENKFTDIDGHWAAPYINAAVENGWIAGYPDKTFRPDAYITRAEVAILINRVLKRSVTEDGLHKDAKQWPDNRKNDWYYEQIEEATNFHEYERASDSERWMKLLPNRVWDEKADS